MRLPIILFVALSLTACAAPSVVQIKQEVQPLVVCCPIFSPSHQNLYDHYAVQYRPVLEKYSDSQLYDHPCTKKAIVLHEMLHIASASNNGYVLGNRLITPYRIDPVWSNDLLVDLRQARSVSTEDELRLMHAVMPQLLIDEFSWNLAGILDEINAYMQTINYLVDAKEKHDYQQKFYAHLTIFNSMVRYLQQSEPEKYLQLKNGKASSATVPILTLALQISGKDFPEIAELLNK